MRDSNEPVIGRSAVLFLLTVFLVAVAIAVMLSTKAHAKVTKPECVPGRAVATCSITFGSSDKSGFVSVHARRKGEPGSAGQELATIVFQSPRADEPQCEVRASSDGELPAVTLRAASDGLTLILRDDARLPLSMRWYYVCR